MLPLYDNIRRRRIELNMSQQELADKAGYSSGEKCWELKEKLKDVERRSKDVER